MFSSDLDLFHQGGGKSIFKKDFVINETTLIFISLISNCLRAFHLIGSKDRYVSELEIQQKSTYKKLVFTFRLLFLNYHLLRHLFFLKNYSLEFFKS